MKKKLFVISMDALVHEDIAYLRTKQQQKAKQKSENKKINDTRLPTKERSYQNG